MVLVIIVHLHRGQPIVAGISIIVLTVGNERRKEGRKKRRKERDKTRSDRDVKTKVRVRGSVRVRLRVRVIESSEAAITYLGQKRVTSHLKCAHTNAYTNHNDSSIMVKNNVTWRQSSLSSEMGLRNSLVIEPFSAKSNNTREEI